MTDEELIARMRGGGLISIPARVAADHIETLVKEKTALKKLIKTAFEEGFLEGAQSGWLNDPKIKTAWNNSEAKKSISS